MTGPPNDLLLCALRREPVNRTPVWLMRQAGRYLPEYREVRARAGSFMALCTNPELACEVTLQPLDRFRLDAAILFSDILTIPDAMGLGLEFLEGEGPHFRHPVRSVAEIERLHVPDPDSELGYVMDAARLVRNELDERAPLIGFAGSPWTLATYMVEGGPSASFQHVKGLLYDAPDALHQLLGVLATSVARYLDAQIAAGAHAVMIFDTWGGALTPETYREFSLRYMARAIDEMNRTGDLPAPVILFTKGGGGWLEDIAATGCDAIGIDWTTDLADARARVGSRVALQGNLDPAVLYAAPERIREQVARVLESYGPGPGHVFNLGHGLQPQMIPEHVHACIEAVRDLSPSYHRAYHRGGTPSE